jgi:hypothetical protein
MRTDMTGIPAPSESVEVRYDDFSKATTILGIGNTDLPGGNLWFLRSNGVRDEWVHAVYVKRAYARSDLVAYNRAVDEHGNALDVVQIDWDVDCGCGGWGCEGDKCLFTEDYTILVPEAVLREHAQSGYRIKCYGKVACPGGTEHGCDPVVTLTPEMIQAQLAAMAEPRQ